jgi:hypothetical protein
MRILLGGIIATALAVCAFSAGQPTAAQKPVAKKKSAPKSAAKPAAKTAVKTPVIAGKRTGSATATARKTAATRRTGKRATVKQATWRYRQMAPTADRYKEIQAALVSKGYLQAEQANGVWDQNSIDALKKFQADQNLESSGKINSLSIIALGLGPKRDTAAVKSSPPPVQTDR